MFKFMDALFGCSHRNRTFPITAKPGDRRSQAAAITGTYVVCLDCGKEFPYDWRQMKVVSGISRGSALASSRHAVNRVA